MRENDGAQVFMCMSQVWGEEYSVFFVEYVLPSLLSQGNLGGEYSCAFEFNLFTTKEDWQRIKDYPAVRVLQEKADLVLRFIELSEGKGTFDLMNECQETIAKEAQIRDLPAIYLQPDVILSDGCIRSVVGHWNNGIRCVLFPSVRANKETFIPDVTKGKSLGDGVLSLNPEEMVDSLVNNLHEISLSLNIDSEFFSSHPSHVYFLEGSKGMTAICAHVHPLMVHATASAGFDGDTLDAAYVHNAVSDNKLIYTVYDSSECIVVEVSSSKKNFGEYLAQKFDWEHYMGWVSRSTTSTQRYFMCEPSLLKGSKWEDGCLAEQRVREFIKNFYKIIESPSSVWFWRMLYSSTLEKTAFSLRVTADFISRLPVIGRPFSFCMKTAQKAVRKINHIKKAAKVRLSYFKSERWINKYGAQVLHPIYAEACAVNDQIAQVFGAAEGVENVIVLNETWRFNIGNNIRRAANKEVRSFADFNHAKLVLEKDPLFPSYEAILLIDANYNLKELFSELNTDLFSGLDNVTLVISDVNPDLRFSKKRKYKIVDKVSNLLEGSGSEYLAYIYVPRANQTSFIPDVLYKIESIRVLSMFLCSCAISLRRLLVKEVLFRVSKSGADRRWSYAVCRLHRDQLPEMMRKISLES